MIRLCTGLALLALCACTGLTDGTPEARRCLAAKSIVAAMEGGGVPEGYTLDNARDDARAICGRAQ